MNFSFQEAFQHNEDLQQYGKDSLALFALQLKFQIQDIHTVATSSLIDRATGGDDKKCDLIYVDRERGYIVIIQAYMADDPSRKQAAPSNKASDLNTAATWSLNAPIIDLPEGLQSAVAEVRELLQQDMVSSLQFWYVHNCPESQNVKKELNMVEHTIKNNINANFPKAELDNFLALEVGQETLEEWYKALQAPIFVTDEIEFSIKEGYSLSDSDWEAYVTAISIKELYELFQQYSENLFSANIRDYLGSRKSSSNINHGIKETADKDHSHFWTFNNGITVLVHNFEVSDHSETEYSKLKLNGFSIVNGAQTTGALGSLSNYPNQEGLVQARFVKCSNVKTIRKIIEYNNRQNQIEASDFRSNDQIQQRLRQEFEDISDIEYYGGRRGGYEDVIRRPPNLLPSDTVAQALAAFHQDPITAYNNKSDIWKIDTIYSKYFNEQTTSSHIIFVYCLLRAIESKKKELNDKNQQVGLSESEQEQLAFFNKRGSHFLFLSGVSKCLEILVSESVPNSFKIGFNGGISLDLGEKIWKNIIDVLMPFTKHLKTESSTSLARTEEVRKAITSFKDVVDSVKEYHEEKFAEFQNEVLIQQ